MEVEEIKGEKSGGVVWLLSPEEQEKETVRATNGRCGGDEELVLFS